VRDAAPAMPPAIKYDEICGSMSPRMLSRDGCNAIWLSDDVDIELGAEVEDDDKGED